MARRKIQFLPGNYYHVYNRGANRELIFRNESNYHFLLRRVKENMGKFQICVLAYCLMPNHYHFLLRQEGDPTISAFMQAVFNSYTKAFNNAHQRTGTLFEGPFRATFVDQCAYLLHLCRYIHRNPLEAGLAAHPAEWPFSNYLEWIDKRPGSLVDRDFIREHFSSPGGYEEFVLEYTPSREMDETIHKLALE
jgi:REP element-mobilizing transposase RayT